MSTAKSKGELKVMDANREIVLQLIDEATEPKRMRPAEALTFLEELHTDIDGRIEGLKDEHPELES
jgi:hypothetical protein